MYFVAAIFWRVPTTVCQQFPCDQRRRFCSTQCSCADRTVWPVEPGFGHGKFRVDLLETQKDAGPKQTTDTANTSMI
jgi:hypothetical protein